MINNNNKGSQINIINTNNSAFTKQVKSSIYSNIESNYQENIINKQGNQSIINLQQQENKIMNQQNQKS